MIQRLGAPIGTETTSDLHLCVCDKQKSGCQQCGTGSGRTVQVIFDQVRNGDLVNYGNNNDPDIGANGIADEVGLSNWLPFSITLRHSSSLRHDF